MFYNPFSFDGRIRRREYVLSYLIFLAIFWSCGIISASLTDSAAEGWGANAFFLVPLLPATWFIIAQGIKRCHDRGNSGWWLLVPFYHFWMLFADGDIGPNEYGENPNGLNFEH